jgi:nickel transport protein
MRIQGGFHRFCCGLALAALLFPGTALAHKVIHRLSIEGDAVVGRIGYFNAGWAADAPVAVKDDRGRVLFETRTDAEGRFRFVPTETTAHLIHANLGGGHVLDVRVEATDLPFGVAAKEEEVQPKPHSFWQILTGR